MLAVERDQRRHGDQASFLKRESRTRPDRAEQHLCRVCAKVWGGGGVCPRRQAEPLHDGHSRRDLIDAADRVFRKKGVDAVIVRDVITAARVAHGTFYNYFDGIDELAEAMIRTRLAEMADRLEAMRQDLPQDELAIAIAARVLFREIGHSTAATWLVQRPHVLARALEEAVYPFASQDVVRLAKAGRVCVPCSTEGWFAAVSWMLIGLLMRGLAGGTRMAVVEDEFLKTLLASLGVTGAPAAQLVKASRAHLGPRSQA